MLNPEQEVRLQVIQELLNNKEYEYVQIDRLIDDASEIVKYIMTGEQYRCDSAVSSDDAAKSTILPNVQLKIIAEIAETLSMLGASSGLMACIGSWGDTMTQDEILEMWRDWNKSAKQKGWIIKPAIFA